MRGAASAAGADALRADPLVDELEDEEVVEVVVAERFAEFEGGEAAAAEPPLSPGS